MEEAETFTLGVSMLSPPAQLRLYETAPLAVDQEKVTVALGEPAGQIDWAEKDDCTGASGGRTAEPKALKIMLV